MTGLQSHTSVPKQAVESSAVQTQRDLWTALIPVTAFEILCWSSG
jgi:hypothetical protein